MLVGLGNGILTSSVYIVEVVSANRRGSVVMVGYLFNSCLHFVFAQLVQTLNHIINESKKIRTEFTNTLKLC